MAVAARNRNRLSATRDRDPDARTNAELFVVDLADIPILADALKFAAWFPATLVLAFGAIFLYFRARGGYKPVELTDSSGGDGGH